MAKLRGIKRKAVERFDGSIILKTLDIPSLQALERVKADLAGYLIDDLNYAEEYDRWLTPAESSPNGGS